MIRVLSVFGTRPEAIKMAPVVHAPPSARRTASRAWSASRPSTATCSIRCSRSSRSTADHDLDLMMPGQSPAGVAARVLERLPPLLRRIRPDVLLVQGDTMTTFAAALRRLPRADPVGTRRGRSPDRRPVPAVPGGDEPGADHPARRAPLRAHRAGRGDALLAEGVPAGRRAPDRQHGDRRAARRRVRPDYGFRTPAARRARSRRAGWCWSPPTGGRASGRRSAVHLRRDPGAGRAVPRPAVRAAGAPQSRGQGARSSDCSAICPGCT